MGEPVNGVFAAKGSPQTYVASLATMGTGLAALFSVMAPDDAKMNFPFLFRSEVKRALFLCKSGKTGSRRRLVFTSAAEFHTTHAVYMENMIRTMPCVHVCTYAYTHGFGQSLEVHGGDAGLDNFFVPFHVTCYL
jgi:hypothetical protein